MEKNDRQSKFGKFRGKKPTEPESPLDYKNLEYLLRLIGPTGKILSRRRTGFDGQNQRRLDNAIKRARFLGLLPFTGSHGGHREMREPREPREYRDRGDRDNRDRDDSRS